MEDLETLRKRLLYQSHHRGMRELDFILGRFANRHVPSMTQEELEQLEALLVIPDQELYGWFFEKIEAPTGPLRSLALAIQKEFS